jgi:transcription antitermination factor NusG
MPLPDCRSVTENFVSEGWQHIKVPQTGGFVYMSIPKTAKVDAEILKIKGRILEQQAKLKELENKKIGIENSEIVSIVRGLSIPLDQLATVLQSIKGGTYGQNVHKSKKAEIKEEVE